MKFYHYLAIMCVLGIACILTVGCDKMEKPVMDAMDMATMDDPLQPVDPPEMGPVDPPEMYDPLQPVDPPEPEMEAPAFPEDFEALPDDNVVHVTELSIGPQVYLNDAGELDINGELHVYDTLIADNDDFLQVILVEGASEFFEWWDLQIAEKCKGGSITDTGDMTMYFPHPNRSARDEFVQEITRVFENQWQFHSAEWRILFSETFDISTSVVILNNVEVYYAVSFDTNVDALDTVCE